MRYISSVRSLYFRIYSASFLITFLSPKIATSINIHVPFSLSRIIMSGYYYYYYYHHHHHHRRRRRRRHRRRRRR